MAQLNGLNGLYGDYRNDPLGQLEYDRIKRDQELYNQIYQMRALGQAQRMPDAARAFTDPCLATKTPAPSEPNKVLLLLGDGE